MRFFSRKFFDTKARPAKFERSRGFTTMEVLIVLAILIFIGYIVTSGLWKRRDTEVVRSEASQVLAVLDKAREDSMASKNYSQYGVHIQSDKVVQFTGTTYSAGAGSNISHILDTRAQIKSISLTGGGSDVLFSRITGVTSQPGTFKIYSTVSSTTASTTIKIYDSGISEIQ